MSQSTPQLVHVVPSSTHRFLFLDGLRGTAALLVVLFHLPPEMGKMMPAHNAYLAVDLFFVLSGFVLCFSYEKRLESQLRWFQYWVARIIRLWPVYLLGTAIGFLHYALLGHMRPTTVFTSAALSVLMLPNLSKSAAMAFPLDFPAWSLFWELMASSAYGAIVRKRAAGSHILVVVCAISLGLLVLCQHRVANLNVGVSRTDFYWGLPRVLYSFLAGVLACRIFRQKGKINFSPAAGTTLLIAVPLLIVALLTTPLTSSAAGQLLAVTVAFPSLVYLGASLSIPHSLETMTRFLGDISYPIYLLHIHFVSALQIPALQRIILHQPLSRPLIVIALLSIIVPLSWAAANLYDLPIRTWLARTFNQRIAASARPGGALKSNPLSR